MRSRLQQHTVRTILQLVIKHAKDPQTPINESVLLGMSNLPLPAHQQPADAFTNVRNV